MNNQISAEIQISEQPAQVAVQEIVQLPLSTLALIGGGQAITSCY
jgi:hypothetical protein